MASTSFFRSLFTTQEDADLYKYVALTASLMMFHYIITGFTAGGARGKIFTPEFMEENFGREHERHYPEGSGVALSKKGGFPDMGSGRYADKLSYKSWFEFNNAQRIHYNYLESVTSIVCWLLIAGMNYPKVAIAFGALYILGRIMYHIGYNTKGPNGRIIGFASC